MAAANTRSALRIPTPAWGAEFESRFEDAETYATDRVWDEEDRELVEEEAARLGGKCVGSRAYFFQKEGVTFWNGYWYK